MDPKNIDKKKKSTPKNPFNINIDYKKIEKDILRIKDVCVKKLDEGMSKGSVLAEQAIKKIDFKKQPLYKKSGIIVSGLMVGVMFFWAVGRITWPILYSLASYVVEVGGDTKVRKKTKRAPVEVHTIKIAPMSKRIQTNGKIRPNEIVTIKAEISERIVEIPVKEGTEVKKDDVLIRFDDSDEKAEVKLAEAELLARRSAYNRLKELRDKKIESGKNFDDAEAGYHMAEAKLDAAKAKLDKTVIKAPFNGNLGLVEPSVGSFVQPNQELVTIVDNNPVKVDFTIPERNIHDVGIGQAAEIRLDGFKDQVFMSTVEAIDSKVDSKSHSIAVRASVPNPNNLLRGGLFASVSLIIGEKGDVVQVPEASIEREGEVEFVWVVNNGKANRKRVLTGVKENSFVEIVAGLAEGEVVVISGQLRLGDGMPVTIIDPADKDKKEDVEAKEEQ